MNVTSGRARFQRHGARSVVFEGQAKKPTETEGYVIPLLCETDLFLGALDILKDKRGDISSLSNEQIKRKMNGGLRSMHVHRTFPTLPEGAHFHTLRSIYFHLVDVLYAHTYAYNELARLLLGHVRREESHAYTSVRLEGVQHLKDWFGVLSLSLEPIAEPT